MLKSCSIIFCLFLIISASASAETPRIEPGVSKKLATWRTDHYSDVRYKIDLRLEKMSPVLKGAIEVRLRVRGSGEAGVRDGGTASIPIVLDWRKISGHEKKSRVFDVSLNGKSVTPEELNQHLVFRDGVKEGENFVKLSFESPILKSGSAITRYIDSQDGSEYIYSLFVPSDASTAFPVFDQPDLKAKFSLKTEIPKGWQSITNSNI